MKIDGSRWVGLSAAAVFAALLVSGVFGIDAAAQDAKKQPPPKASPCKGLDEKTCKGKSAECTWIAPKTGKQKSYCRLKPRKKV